MKIIGRTKKGMFLAELNADEAQALNNFCGAGWMSDPYDFDMDIVPQIKLAESIGMVTQSITYTKETLKKYIDERFPDDAKKND